MSQDTSRYALRGVSAGKEEVHRATAGLDKGLFPYAFCKAYPDYLGGSDAHCNLMHADGTGTKSVLAYLYWKETGDLSVWGDVAVDAVVMNTDDLLCVGATGPFTYSSTIGRAKSVIPGEVIAEVIRGTQECFERMEEWGFRVHFLGGETADVGDAVRTIIIDGTMAARMRRDRVVTNERIAPGDLVVSLASFGKSAYEEKYNSGIGSNGLTSARHEILSHHYAEAYPESVDPALPKEVVYNGTHRLTDAGWNGLNIGQMLLSPTRTYAPLMTRLLASHFDSIHGLVHNTGGGLGKCLHYLPGPMRVVKDNLFTTPPVFNLIQQSAGTPWKEMYQVFNMGQRLEIYTDERGADAVLTLADDLGIEAQVSGRVETCERKEVVVDGAHGTHVYA